MSTPIRILVVEDNPGDARLVEEVLKGSCSPRYAVEHVGDLNDALRALACSQPADVVLLDLGLPDGSGLETVRRVSPFAHHSSIVVMTGIDDEEMGAAALREGAQDYLVKGRVDPPQLLRAIRYSIVRRHTHASLRDLTLRDALTGLYNRRGFITLADHHMRLAERDGRDLLVLFADADGLKQINDTFGHEHGDQALLDVTSVLKDSFRPSDIVARLGGDEFAVLALVGTSCSEALLRHRIQKKLDDLNTTAGRPFTVALSLGTFRCQYERHLNIQDLLARADALMYADKHSPGRLRELMAM